jgi:uncharacterized protein
VTLAAAMALLAHHKKNGLLGRWKGHFMRAIVASGANAVARCCTLVLVLLLCGCSWLDVKQRELALRPAPGRPAAFADGSPALLEAFRPGDQRFLVSVPAADPAEPAPQQLSLWWLPAPEANAPTLLYLHGTFRNLYPNLPKIQALRDAGFAVVAVDYRGWGDSTAIVPSEETINADVRVAWAEMQRRQPDARLRVIFGHSMGGAAAVTLASNLKANKDYSALVLESTFSRLPDVAEAAGFWGRVGALLTTLKFDSKSRIGSIDAPIWMLHGDADKVVPVSVGRLLRDAAPTGTRWIEVPGGSHSQLHQEAAALYQQTFKDLIDKLQRDATPR